MVTLSVSIAFEISNDGVITTKMELNRENVPLYELIVVAQDNGVPTMQGNASVIVHIIDENDNSPEFTNGSLMEVEVIEVCLEHLKQLSMLFLHLNMLLS